MDYIPRVDFVAPLDSPDDGRANPCPSAATALPRGTAAGPLHAAPPAGVARVAVLTCRQLAGVTPKENAMPTAPQPLRTRKRHRPDATSSAQQFAKRTASAPARVLEYPESDGRPMAETPIHMKAMNDAIMPLDEHYAERDDVYVGGNMMMYYVEHSPGMSVSADVFVAFGPSREPLRRVWKTWEEGKLADFVLEVTSKSTRGDDEERKRDIYRRLGVTEYWQFDPTGDYLEPVLKGRRLNATGAYRPIRLTTAPDGTLRGQSKVLGLHLCLDGSRLRLFDPVTSAFLPTNHDKYLIIKDRERALAERDGAIEEKDRAIEERDRAIAQERRAREAAETELEQLKGRRTRR